jgi:hypothetical protein
MSRFLSPLRGFPRADYEKYNPFREPDWRFRRVHELVAAGQRPLRGDDSWTRRFCKFYRQVVTRAALNVAPTAIADPSGFDEALRISLTLDLRAELSAWILTGETDEEIAARLAIAPQSVECFEQIFFNVRDRLEGAMWILKVIGASPAGRSPLAPDGTLTAKHVYTTWQAFAYYGGPLVFERVLGALPRGAMSPTTAQVAAFWAGEMFLNAIELMKVHAKIMAAGKAPSASPPRSHETNVMAFLDGMESFQRSAAGTPSEGKPSPPA